MDETADILIDRALYDFASKLVEQLLNQYQNMADERRVLHERAFADETSQAGAALDLIEVPFDTLANSVRRLSTSISVKDRRRLDVALIESELAGQHALISWLREEAHCPQVADFLERSDYLRLLLMNALHTDPKIQLGEKRSA